MDRKAGSFATGQNLLAGHFFEVPIAPEALCPVRSPIHDTSRRREHPGRFRHGPMVSQAQAEHTSRCLGRVLPRAGQQDSLQDKSVILSPFSEIVLYRENTIFRGKSILLESSQGLSSMIL